MLHSTPFIIGFVALLYPQFLSAALLSSDFPQGACAARRSYNESDSCEHGPHSRNCWSGGLSIETDYHVTWPDTGKTVKYEFDICNMTMAPDGVEKQMMVINGQYPGPTIVADWGDDIEVAVTNSLTNNGTGIHWHGLRQFGSNEMDGVAGITECPIAPGQTRVYRFKATQYGTSWYHSHYSVQYGDGIVGGIVINGPASANYDIDLGVMPFTDWFHSSIFTVNAATLHSKGPPIADNLLVNGTMTSSSGGQYGVTTLTPGKSHRLRLINSGINNWVHVALDGHPFTVIAADFIPIVPYQTSSVVLAIGQRYDIIIHANQTVDNYWLRVGTGGGRCDGPNANAEHIGSIFRYANATDAEPRSEADAPLPTGCYDETNIVPVVSFQVPREEPEEMSVGFTDTAGSGNLVQWLVNKTPLLIDYGHPTLQQVIDGNTTFKKADNAIVVTEPNKFQYWVIQQDNTSVPVPHPIHLHGHDFFVLDQQSHAQWMGDTSRLKTDNPIRRDTVTLPAFGYIVVAFASDNPGTWLMHCHVSFHLAGGFALQFVERLDEIVGSIGQLGDFERECKAWTSVQKELFPGGNDVGDSGLR